MNAPMMPRTPRAAGPRTDSPEYQVLMHLLQLGGTAPVRKLMPSLQVAYHSQSRFFRYACEPLCRFGFAQVVDAAVLMLTEKGRDFAAAQSLTHAPAPAVSSKVAQLCRMQALRPGALDYRSIPSLMGGQRVPFHGKRNA